MKLKKLFLIILTTFITNLSFSQIITGGNISLSGTIPNEVKDSEMGISQKTNNTINFSLTPRVGYLLLEDKLEVGGAIGFSYSQETNYEILYQLINERLRDGKSFKDLRTDKFTLAFSPYLRYRIAHIKTFGIWFEGVTSISTIVDLGFKYYPLGPGYNKEYQYIERSLEETSKLNDVEKNLQNQNLTWGFIIKPILTKEVNDHWRLETGLNFMCLGITGVYNSTKYLNDTGEYITRKSHICNYTLGVWNGDVINIGILTIGAVYKF